jgi:TIR domain-containing protein
VTSSGQRARLNGYYACFISYASADHPFAARLYNDLQREGVRCWFAPEDMKIGDPIRPAIGQAITMHEKLLLILSEKSLVDDHEGHAGSG